MSSLYFTRTFPVFGQIENLWMDDVYIQFRETEMVEIP